MGKDGLVTTHSLVGYDMYGFSLGYFTGDYSAIGNISAGQQPFAIDTQMHCWDLFNGNISRMKVFNFGLDGTLNGNMDTTMAYRYRYDQLNRLTGMDAQVGVYNYRDSTLHYTSMPDYGEHVSYDPNGNILSYFRNGTTANGGPLAMDSLSYKYQPGNNKLDHVNDAVPATNYSVDIDNEDTLNYNYDQIGALTKDTASGIDSIYWTVYGKIWEIVKYNGDTIKFRYDPMGNRIAKEVFVDSLHRWTDTYYTHDATGNIMATYQWVNRDTFTMDELVMYGSSRLGTYGVNVVLCDTVTRDSGYYALHDTSTNPCTDSVTYFTAGLKQYEFTNHLGNVLLTLTDRHTPFYLFGVSYLPEVASAQDYYPYGMEMVGRAYNPALYRFGYNKGSEKDNEIAGVGNHFTTKDREGDTRLAIWWGVDPKTKDKPDQSPYTSMDGNPILNNDPTGDGVGDIIAGIVVAVATDILPAPAPGSLVHQLTGTTDLRTLYTPTDANDYNNALQVTDNTVAAVGKTAQVVGTVEAVAGLATMEGGAGAVATGVGAVPGGAAVVVGGAAAVEGMAIASGGTYLVNMAQNNKDKGYNYGNKKGPKDLKAEAEAEKLKRQKSEERTQNRQQQSREGQNKEGKSNQRIKGEHNTSGSGSNKQKHTDANTRRAKDQRIKGPDMTY